MEKKVFTPRFEFRIFGSEFQVFIKLYHDLFPNSEITKRTTISDEIYLISSINNNFNIKIRDNRLDIKKLNIKSGSLEQWEPFFKTDFPIDVKTLQKKVLSIFQIKSLSPDQSKYTQKQFLSLIQNYSFINRVEVHKNRTQYITKEIMFEIADIDIEGKTLQTICVESTNEEKLLKLLKKLRIDTMKNTNYIEEIKLLRNLK